MHRGLQHSSVWRLNVRCRAPPAELPCNKEPPQCSPTTPGQQCRAQNVNIDGQVLVLDVIELRVAPWVVGWRLPAGAAQLRVGHLPLAGAAAVASGRLVCALVG